MYRRSIASMGFLLALLLLPACQDDSTVKPVPPPATADTPALKHEEGGDEITQTPPGQNQLQVMSSANALTDLPELHAPADSLDCMIEPYLTVDVATSASGVVKEVAVDRGYVVSKGQVLARLENEVEKANVAQSLARFEFATSKYERMQDLVKQQVVSTQQFEEAKSEHDLAAAELQKNKELLNQRTIVSPLSGVVVDRYVSPGELVENKKVVKVAQIDPLSVEIIAPVSMVGDFKLGAKVLVNPEGPNSGGLVAHVQLVDRVVDAPSGTFRVRLKLSNPRLKIPAGVRCTAHLAKQP